jgi:hypothetical protein
VTEPATPGGRDAVIGRYSGLARAALAGAAITDCDPHAQYRDLLLAAGFTGITITTTNQASPGLHSAIVQATRPTNTGPVPAWSTVPA